MNCTSCGANLPPGATTCPTCGVPTPYNVSGSHSGQYDPTVAAPQYGGPPSTSYDSNPYNQPPNPYEGGLNNPNPYGAPPQQPYSAPQQQPYSAPPQQPYGVPPQQPYNPPPKKSNVGRTLLIAGAIVLVVVVLGCVGIVYAVTQASKTALSSLDKSATSIAATSTADSKSINGLLTPGTTPNTGTTPQATTSGSSPLGHVPDPAAAAIITTPQMASAVDTNAGPTTLSTTFAVKQPVYATFKLQGGHSGYAEAKWYADDVYVFTSKILTVKQEYNQGEFAAYFNIPNKGTVELYWCTQSDCSDAKLAQSATFTVSSGSSIQPVSPHTALSDMDTRRAA